jgi:hypothetical protein
MINFILKLFIILLLITQSVYAQLSIPNFIRYPFTGIRYFINKNEPSDYFLVKLLSDGQMTIDHYTNNSSETVFEGKYNHIVSDNYGSYLIEKEKFGFQSPFENNKVIYYLPDSLKNAAFENKMKISNGTIKLFVGNFTSDKYKGKASYHYVLNNQQDEIFMGSFQFKGNNGSGGGLNMSGQFVNDQKNGLWTYLRKINNLGLNIYNERLTMNYDNGIINGTLNLSSNTTIKYKQKNYILNVSASVEVENNNFIGKVTYISKILGGGNKISPVNLTGQFNNSGYCDGTWYLAYAGNDDQVYDATFEFINGILITYKSVDHRTGEVIADNNSGISIDEAKQLTDDKMGNREIGKWKTEEIELLQMGEVNSDAKEYLDQIEQIMSDPALNLPKGFMGNLPKFKVRAQTGG